MRLPDREVTLTLTTGRAQLIAAALHVFGWLASGDSEDDPDTELTAEAREAYLNVMRQLHGGDDWHSPPSSGDVKALAQQLERDMLAIVHRNYRRTTKGFERK